MIEILAFRKDKFVFETNNLVLLKQIHCSRRLLKVFPQITDDVNYMRLSLSQFPNDGAELTRNGPNTPNLYQLIKHGRTVGFSVGNDLARYLAGNDMWYLDVQPVDVDLAINSNEWEWTREEVDQFGFPVIK